MNILYYDDDIVVCVKPAGVLSTDEPGGLPELLRAELGGEIRTVHRLDRVTGGLVVTARNREAAKALSAQIASDSFFKAYLAVIHGTPEQAKGSFRDLLCRDKRRKMTFVAAAPGKDAREALLDYEVLSSRNGLSLVRIVLHTGRTHQIRVQFASRGLPLVGERKYHVSDDPCPLALFSAQLGFVHPVTGVPMGFTAGPEDMEPWTLFSDVLVS